MLEVAVRGSEKRSRLKAIMEMDMAIDEDGRGRAAAHIW